LIIEGEDFFFLGETMEDVCEVIRCTCPTSVYYSVGGKQRGVCMRHWGKHVRKRINLRNDNLFKKGKPK